MVSFWSLEAVPPAPAIINHPRGISKHECNYQPNNSLVFSSRFNTYGMIDLVLNKLNQSTIPIYWMSCFGGSTGQCSSCSPATAGCRNDSNQPRPNDQIGAHLGVAQCSKLGTPNQEVKQIAASFSVFESDPVHLDPTSNSRGLALVPDTKAKNCCWKTCGNQTWQRKKLSSPIATPYHLEMADCPYSFYVIFRFTRGDMKPLELPDGSIHIHGISKGFIVILDELFHGKLQPFHGNVGVSSL